MVLNVLRQAMPQGGEAFLVNAKKFRKGIQFFTPALEKAGFSFTETSISCTGTLQQLVCGDFEPEQEYVAYRIKVERATDS
mmetsp:Transcript_67468/g.121581  ORF Transcript_67468/g.121581 Transcript_67468/m.121581 type:complete len:81 (-) Transcript_67468:22-264(-)